jgi:hypothetical protein
MRSQITGTAYDFMRMDLPCPECGKTNKEPICELVANDTAACRVLRLGHRPQCKGYSRPYHSVRE